MPWIEIKECPLCGCKDSMLVGHGQRPIIQSPAVIAGAALAILTSYEQCLGCGLIRQTPRLSDSEIADYYTSGVYRKLINESPDRQDEFERKRYQRIYDMLPEPLPGAKLLDVGCSHGYLLDMTGDAWDTLG